MLCEDKGCDSGNGSTMVRVMIGVVLTTTRRSGAGMGESLCPLTWLAPERCQPETAQSTHQRAPTQPRERRCSTSRTLAQFVERHCDEQSCCSFTSLRAVFEGEQ